MPSRRLFVALPLPDDLRILLSGLNVPSASLAWTRPEQLHVTLRFLGDVDEAQVEPLADALDGVKVAPFILPLEGVGTFPPRGAPKIIWVGVGHAHPLLFQLRQQLDDALLGCGLEFDVRLFHPHVTLARVKSPAGAVSAQHFVKRHRDFEGPPFRVAHFGLYASELLPRGAVHTLVREFALGT